MAIEGYRSRSFGAAQLRRMLGFETRMEVDRFLQDHPGRLRARPRRYCSGDM